ncbi:MAG: PAS domain-containing sensor histidine kinase [Dehalococcoidia bacterium]
MKDERKTRKQLVDELAQACQRIAELEEAEERWRSLWDNSPDIIVALDREARVLFANRLIPPFTQDMIAGRSIYDFIAPQFHKIARKSFSQTFETGKTTVFEGRGVPPFDSWYLGRVEALKRKGQVIAAAMVNINIEETKYTQQMLRDLSLRLVHAQEVERHRIASELHDQIGQNLTGLRLLLEKADREPANKSKRSMAEAQALIYELTASVRDMSLDLRPWMLDEMGLLPSLLWQFERVTSQTGVRVSFEHKGLQGRFETQLETSVYRIVQEALTNIARHSGARRASVEIDGSEDKLTVMIRDAGAGFDAPSAMANSRSNGLFGMRERVISMGGQFVIRSEPGRGTTISAEFPTEGYSRESNDQGKT